MAYLNKDDRREAWISWATEFVRRGLWPDHEIEIHGSHTPFDFIWGKAEAETHDGVPALIEFRTASGIRSRWDVRGVTIKNAEEPTDNSHW